MDSSHLETISPVDGRYCGATKELSQYFSEAALFRYRALVEIEYFIALCEIPLKQLEQVDASSFSQLRGLYESFTTNDAVSIKETEKTINHDVKAVEYFLKQKFYELGLQEFKEFIHFGLTSQDINNTAVPMLIREALNKVYIPLFEQVRDKLNSKAADWAAVPMLARTHGQPASPTRLGKEFAVFVERLNAQQQLLMSIPFSAKFGGATGNFNAHHVTYPQIDWKEFANRFVNDKLKLQRLQSTTQIEHYDNLAALFDNLKRINTILIDLSKDIWLYISFEIFKQKITEGEIGSSAMPHKVNPIDFENAEGNLGMANAIFSHLSEKLPISRMQRDLTDSTVLRNVGVPFAHTIIAFKSILKGLDKLLLNEDKLKADLDANWMVVSEAIQTILRREGYNKPYEALLDLTRTNSLITREIIQDFIDNLDIDSSVKEELKAITPHNYTGI